MTHYDPGTGHLTGKTYSSSLSGHIDLEWTEPESVVKQRLADATDDLDLKLGRGRTCGYCGQPMRGSASVNGVPVCHPSNTNRQDCYRLAQREWINLTDLACPHCHDGQTRTGAICPWCQGTNRETK